MTGSATVVLNQTVAPSVTIVSTPGDTVCAGTNVSYQVLTSNAGSAPVYDWNVNGLSVSVLDNYNYVPTNGDIVTVTMTSSAVCATPATASDLVTMTVHAAVMPVVTVSASIPGDTLCKGTVVNFTANPTFGGSPIYTWQVNSATVGSGASYAYAPAMGDVIYVTMTSDYPCRAVNTVFSAPVTLVVDTPVSPIVTIDVNPGQHISKGESDTLTAVVPTGGGSFVIPTYQWFINGNIVPGANRQSFISSSFNDGDSVTVQVTATTACGSLSTFNSVIITLAGGVSVSGVQGAAGNIALMPNPNKGDFTVKGTLGSTADQEVTLEITDVLGQVVYTSKVMTRNGVINERIHIGNNIANGMYVLSLRSDTENKVFHVVIEQ